MTTQTEITWITVSTDFGYRYRAVIQSPSWPCLLGQTDYPVWAFASKKSPSVFVGSGIHRRFSDSSVPIGRYKDPLFFQMAYESVSEPMAILPKQLIQIGPNNVTLDIYSDTPMSPADCTGRYQVLMTDKEDPLIHLSEQSDTPTLSEWTTAIASAQAAIKTGPLQKVVLSRKSSFRKTYTDKGHPLYQGFADALLDTDSYHYFYQDNDKTIMGHSPEALFRAEGESVSVDVVAGTRSSGEPDSLLASPKDVNEHAIVLDHVCQILGTYGPVDISERTELSLGTLTHLYQGVSAQVTPTHWAAIIRDLHPTPAIGGAPKKDANTLIARLETDARGWYGGLFGLSIDNTLDLAVAIRGICLTEDHCITQVGAGIVAASDPQQEWEELNRKLASVLGRIGHEITMTEGASI